MAAACEEKTEDSVAAAGQPLLLRRIEFHPARRTYTGVPPSSGCFHLETLNPDSLDAQRPVPGGGSEPSEAAVAPHRKRSAGGEFHEHGFDTELSFGISFQKIGAGLENLGNTCYLNSVLQCLTYTEPFAAYLQSGKHKSTCRTAGFCAMCALQSHVMDALRSTGKILRPFHLVRNLRSISRSFRNSRQEDAHEYMVNLLESMHKSCLPYGVPTESSSAYEKSLVHRIFGGQLRSQVKCMQCSYCSDKFDPFLDLSLEIVRAHSLWKALAHFTAMEELDGGERQYQCQRCKEKVRAFKKLTIHKAPYVLTIHLKRFGSSIRGEKIHKKVEFGSTLNLKPFVSDLHEGALKYTLYGVLVHAGWSTHSGHYFCYVRTSAGLWYSLDDNHVSQVSEKTVLSREAYMLFYVRDRTAAAKCSVEVTPKAYVSANSSGNKGTPLLKSKLDTAFCSSAKVRHDDGIHGRPVPVMDSSGQCLLKTEVPQVQTDGHATTERPCLQVNDDVLSSGLHKMVLPMVNGSVDSKLPSFDTKVMEKFSLTRKGQDSASQQLMDIDSSPDCSGGKNLSDRSKAIDGPLKQEANGIKFMEHQGNCPKVEISSSLHCHKGGESILNLLEAKPVGSLKLSASVISVQQETHEVPKTENLLVGRHEAGPMLKRPKKPFRATTGPYFGRKQLLYMSLKLNKKKLKKANRQHPNSKKKMRKRIVDLQTNSERPSTSNTFRTVNVCSRRSQGMHSYSTSGKKIKENKGVNCGSFSNQRNNQEIYKTCSTDDMLGTAEQPSMPSCSSDFLSSMKVKNAEEKVIHENCPMNLLKIRLRENNVSRWDADDLQIPQINEIEDAPKLNIGYVLDEWDEEYDKGKRKKVKSRTWFVGLNPFQKTANIKAQQRMKTKVVESSLGKEGLRL